MENEKRDLLSDGLFQLVLLAMNANGLPVPNDPYKFILRRQIKDYVWWQADRQAERAFS